MKKKIKIKKTAPNALATGVFKKRKWPWLLVLAGVLCLAIPFAIYANDFFSGNCSSCETLFQHLAPQQTLLNTMFFVFVALVILSIIVTIYPKRSLTITACKILFKRGKKETRVPFSAIDSIDVKGNNGIIVHVSNEKFKFKGLKNRKEVYDALILGVQKNTDAMKEINNISVGPDKATNLSVLTEGKVRYFKNLLNKGVINEKQFADYVEKALETK